MPRPRPPLALSFVSHSEEDVNCLALGPNQYEWPPKRGERRGQHRRRRRRRRRQRAQRGSERVSTMLQVMARMGGRHWKRGRKTAAAAARFDQSCRGRSGESTFAPRTCSSEKKYVQEYSTPTHPPREARRGGLSSLVSPLPACLPACATLLRSSHFSCMHCTCSLAELS